MSVVIKKFKDGSVEIGGKFFDSYASIEKQQPHLNIIGVLLLPFLYLTKTVNVQCGNTLFFAKAKQYNHGSEQKSLSLIQRGLLKLCYSVNKNW